MAGILWPFQAIQESIKFLEGVELFLRECKLLSHRLETGCLVGKLGVLHQLWDN